MEMRQEVAGFDKKSKKFAIKQQTVNVWLAVAHKLNGRSLSNMKSVN